jgi:hypothetical protein
MNFTLTNPTGSTFTLTADGPAAPANPALLADTVVVRVFLSGLIFEGEQARLDISNGRGTSGTSYNVITDDNLLLGGDRRQFYTIQPLPGTPNIVMND